MVHIFGWKKQVEDTRDYKYDAYEGMVLPHEYSLQSRMPGVLDQNALGACVAFGVGAAIAYDQMKQGLPPLTPSHLFIYYNNRVIEGAPANEDSGSSIRTGIKSVAKYGAPPEGLWPYDISKFAEAPSDVCYTMGLRNKALNYQILNQTIYSMKHAIHNGYPVVFGFTVYESFEQQQPFTNGIMPPISGNVLGGHCVIMCGYSQEKNAFLCQNSWGTNWNGDMKGYFYFPYDLITRNDISSDFWTIYSIA